MKKVVWTLGMLALSSGLAAAQDTNELVPTAPIVYEAAGAQAPNAPDKALIAHENKINDASPRVTRRASPRWWHRTPGRWTAMAR